MRLHLVRHGKTERVTRSGRDFDRKLTSRGIEQSRAVGEILQLSSKPIVFCSNAQRTRQTYSHIREKIALPDPTFLDELYLCDKEVFLNLIWQQQGNPDLLFIGHNYGISDLASYLTGNQIILRTGEYVVLEFPFDSWRLASGDTATAVLRFRSPVL